MACKSPSRLALCSFDMSPSFFAYFLRNLYKKDFFCLISFPASALESARWFSRELGSPSVESDIETTRTGLGILLTEFWKHLFIQWTESGNVCMSVCMFRSTSVSLLPLYDWKPLCSCWHYQFQSNTPVFTWFSRLLWQWEICLPSPLICLLISSVPLCVNSLRLLPPPPSSPYPGPSTPRLGTTSASSVDPLLAL